MRLARAAIDFGQFDFAREHLALATEIAATHDSGVYRARVYEDAAKSYFLLGDVSSGEKWIEESKRYWIAERHESQVGRLHEILDWEAQFYCSQPSVGKAKERLASMSTVLKSYGIGQGGVNKRIESSYVANLAVLLSYGIRDPSLEIPMEHCTQNSSGEWIRTQEYFRSYSGKEGGVTAPQAPR